jgi:hypothetical protein
MYKDCVCFLDSVESGTRNSFTMKTLIIAVLSLGVCAQELPKEASIRETSYSGTGCPQNSVSSTISVARDIVTFGFDKFQAIIGPKAKRTETKKSCQLRVGLSYTTGYQLAVLQTTYHGYTRLDDGVNADFESEFYFTEDAGDSNKHVRLQIDQTVAVANVA